MSNVTKCPVCNKTLPDGDFRDDFQCPNPTASQQDIDPEVRDQICGMIAGLPVVVPDNGVGGLPRFLGSSSENGSPRIARCLFASNLSDEDHRNIALALIRAQIGRVVTTPPVKGDRKAIARMIYEAGSPFSSKYAWKEAFRVTDSILALLNK